MPAWYVEGVPTWVASVLSEDAVGDGWWVAYLSSDSVPLFKRSYSAVGFYTHLADVGTDPWSVILPIGQAFVASGYSNLAGWKAAGVTKDFLDSWGSGYAQGRYPGTAWATGANLPHYQPELGPVDPVGDTTVLNIKAPADATDLSQLDIDAPVIEITTTPGADGRISLGGGADNTLDQTGGVNYCSDSSGCVCPSTSPQAKATFTHIDSGIEYASIAGDTTPASMTLTGMSLPAFCAKPAGPVNVCALMPAATVGAIVGQPVGAPHRGRGFSPLAASCTYGVDDASIHYTPDDFHFCRQLASAFARGEGYRLVSGVGDYAQYTRINGLFAFFGHTCIQTFNEHTIDRDASLPADLALLRAFRAKL
jgi:hypothetical protein